MFFRFSDINGDKMPVKFKSLSFPASAALLMLMIQACSSPASPIPGSVSQNLSTDVLTTQESSTRIPTQGSQAPSLDLPELSVPSLVRITMIDLINGWGLTDTKLVRTVDGGSTWIDITPTGVIDLGYSASVFFLDPDTGWVVIPGSDHMTGKIAFTRDGGASWSFERVPFDGGQIDFINATTGFILVNRGAAAGSSAVDVYSTTDGGTNWMPVFQMQPGAGDEVNSLPFGGQKSGMTFLDPQKGWVGGSIPMDGYVYLFASQDGGRTWSKQDLNLPASYETAMAEAMPPRFFDGRNGILPVRMMSMEVAYEFYITHDGGVSWIATLPVKMNGQFALATMSDIFVWDGGPVLQASHDGGLSWNLVQTNLNVSEIFSMMQFVDAQTGWMLTGDAANHHGLYKTMDGGVTWNALIP
jgi:photosystem II stability/assembly factor-like uncharacterized protein